ncbi:MAG: alpha/beta fold hydrolase, partial [Dictyoglomus sp.]
IIDELTKDIDRFHLFGHSLGGVIATRYAEERQEKLKSLVISAPALSVKVDPFTELIVKTLGKLFPSLTINNKLDPEYLSRNKKVIEKCANDPLMHSKISLRLGISMVENIKEAHEKAKDIKVPTLILVPTEDRYVDPNGSREFYKKLGAEDKRLEEFIGGYHELFEDEEYKDRFYELIYTWIDIHN